MEELQDIALQTKKNITDRTREVHSRKVWVSFLDKGPYFRTLIRVVSLTELSNFST